MTKTPSPESTFDPTFDPKVRPLRLGTRASPLALAQSRHVAAQLAAHHQWPAEAIELVEIVTKGDKRLDRKLADIGGKGLFTEELEAGLHAGELDLAVHSLKDLPTQMPDGLTLAAILPRAASRDVMIGRRAYQSLDDIPQGGRIGTASLRRQAQILARRPDLDIVAIRGNVQTRLAKLEDEGLDAIILAAAGLARLQLSPANSVELDADAMLPAAGQGALAVQINAAQTNMQALLAPLHCSDTAACVTAERAFLNALDGSCRTPIAAAAELFDARVHLHGRLLAEDGSAMVEGHRACAIADAATAGRDLAEALRADAPHLVR